MMTTVAQLVIAAILNFLGMAPEAQDHPTPVKAEFFVESRFGKHSLTEEGRIYH